MSEFPRDPFRDSPSPRDLFPADRFGTGGSDTGRSDDDGFGTAFEADFSSFETRWLETPAVDAEQCVIDASELLPAPRASLRDEFIAEVARIEQRRERVRKVPVTVAFLLLVAVCALWPGSRDPRAAAVQRAGSPLDRLNMTNSGPAVVVSASREPDSWALVDAYTSLRAKRSRILFRRTPPRRAQ